jgi:hypothetical protein
MAPSSLRVDSDPLMDELYSSYGSSTCVAATLSSSSTLAKKIKERGRSVAFCKTVKIHTVPSRKHLSKEDNESLYMSRQDSLGIKHGIIVLLEKQQQGQPTNDNDDDTTNSLHNNDDDALRGLEECGIKTAMERRRRIDFAVQSVLRRQELGYEDDEFISELYGKCVRQSSWTAHLRGLQDEQESPYQSSPKKMVMMRS